MLLKSKICFTVLVIYETIAITVLHMTRICSAMFGQNFCADGGYKYILACVLIPLLAMVIAMWINEIFEAEHRRHSMMHKAKDAFSHVFENLRDRIAEKATPADIEKFLTAAVLIGIQHYSAKHPRAKAMLKEIFDAGMGKDSGYEQYAEYGDQEEYEREYDDDEDDDEDEDEEYEMQWEEEYDPRASRRPTPGTSRRTSRTRASAGAKTKIGNKRKH